MKTALAVGGLVLVLCAAIAAIFLFQVGGTKAYENKSLGISFSYPQSWGEVQQENQFDDINVRVTLSFEKMPAVRFITQTRSYSYPAAMDEDSIYYSASYAPYTPAEFCSARKSRCGEGVKPSEQCAKHIVSYCSSNPPQNFLISKASRKNTQATILAEKYKNLGEEEGVINISKHYYFSLQGESFQPLTLLVDAAALKRNTYCLSKENEKLYGCLNEQDGQDIENTVMHFAESSLGKTVDEMVRSLKITAPIDQDNWYKDLVRQHMNLGTEQSSSSSEEANSAPSTATEIQKPKSNGVVVTSPQRNDPSLKTAKSFVVQGSAGADVKKIYVRYICNGYVDAGDSSISRSGEAGKEWNWSYEVKSEDACLGRNSVVFSPSTCDPLKYDKHCQFSRAFDFVSDIAAFNPRTIRMISPKAKSYGEPDDNTLAKASEVVFKGVAGAEVDNIKVRKGGCGERDRTYTTLDHPADATGDWNWEYPIKVSPDGLCRGSNYVGFQPSTMEEGNTCYGSNCYDFFSKVGYIDPKDIVLYRRGTLDSTQDLNDAEEIILEGSAGSEIASIIVHRECSDVSLNTDDKISKPSTTLADGSWEWSYKLSVGGKTICRGNNSIGFTDASTGRTWDQGASGIGAGIQFQSNVGFLPADKQLEAEKVLKYKTGKVKEVKNEITPITISSNDSLYNTACRDPYGLSGGEEEYKEQENAATKLVAGNVISATQKLDPYLSMRLRLPTADERKGKNTSGMQPYDTTAALEFIPSKDAGDIAVPPPLFGWGCNGSATVYYLRPDRIIVDLGQGHESANVIYLWDGKSWRELGTFVPVNNPVSLGAVNKDMFIIEETSACCDIFYPTVAGQWSDFVIDANTLEIIDVHLLGAWRG